MKLRFFGKKAKKNEYNRSSSIEDLPLLLLTGKVVVIVPDNSIFIWVVNHNLKLVSEICTLHSYTENLVDNGIFDPCICVNSSDCE